MRPYQIYAVKRAFERIMGSNLNGYVFHTTGSGKTLTSYKLASLLRDDRRIDKVFFLIDRKDLDDQTVDEYNSFEPGCVDNTDNTKQLVAALGDSTKTLIVTTIQKMASALKNPKYAEKMETLRQKKCVFIIDECHRSQFGRMHGDIQRHFQNANYIGFTGTPIFKENKSADGRTTADVFTSGKLDSCIHRYMIKEAIADGNVLRFSVEYMRSLNITKVDDPSLDASQLDDPEYCKRHKIDLEDLYHREIRINNIADDVLKNLERHTHPTGKDVYTAIFAVDSIKTLKLSVSLWPAYAEQDANKTVNEGGVTQFRAFGYALADGTKISAEWEYALPSTENVGGEAIYNFQPVAGTNEFGGIEEVTTKTVSATSELKNAIEFGIHALASDNDLDLLWENAGFEAVESTLTINKPDVAQDGYRFRVHFTATSEFGTQYDWYSDIANEWNGSWNTQDGAFGNFSRSKKSEWSSQMNVIPPDLDLITAKSADFAQGAVNQDLMTPDEYGQTLLLKNINSVTTEGTAA